MPSERQRGFTLIELAIVLVVIGILLGLGVALMGPLTKQALFKMVQSLHIRSAGFGYYANERFYMPI